MSNLHYKPSLQTVSKAFIKIQMHRPFFFFFKVISSNNECTEIIISFVEHLCLTPTWISLINKNSSESAFNLLLSIDVECFHRQLKIEISL